jgi:hypothetical protein
MHCFPRCYRGGRRFKARVGEKIWERRATQKGRLAPPSVFSHPCIRIGIHLLHRPRKHRILHRSPFPLFFCVSAIRHSASTVNRSSPPPWKYSKWRTSRGWLLLFTVLAEWRIVTNSAYAKNIGDGLLYSILWRKCQNVVFCKDGVCTFINIYHDIYLSKLTRNPSIKYARKFPECEFSLLKK